MMRLLVQLLLVKSAVATYGSMSQGVHQLVDADLSDGNDFHVYSSCTSSYALDARGALNSNSATA
eukprot:1195718-Prorocentrum_minimum.AAC.13